MGDFRKAVEAAMINRALQGEPYTYREMASIERRQGAPRERSLGHKADQIMQRWRRNGWATYTRIGRDTLWSLTDAGRAALAGKEG